MHRFAPLLCLWALLLVLPGLESSAAQSSTRLYLPLLAAPSLTASYLGGPDSEAASAADFDRAGQLLLGGRWPAGPIGGVQATALPGGEGAVVRLDPSGRAVAAAARVGGSVSDMEASAAGPVIVCGDFGIASLSAGLDALLWRDAPGPVSRCAAGISGAAVALVGTTVYRYNADGSGRSQWNVASTAVADLALDEVNGLVFATGYTQKASDLKVVFLRAYGGDGSLRWAGYDVAASAAKEAGLSADTEGRRVSIGADGKLYFAGATDGGNALYSRDPQNLSRALDNNQLVAFDAYNAPYNLSGAKSLVWYGRFEPTTGALLLGQWLLTRLDDGKGNSIGVQALDAAADGTVAVAGDSYYALAKRLGMRFAGVRLGDYESGEPYLLVVSPDFKTRRLWTALAAPGTTAGGSGANGVAISTSNVGLAATLNPRASGPTRGLLTTPGALQPTLGSPNRSEAYYLLMTRP